MTNGINALSEISNALLKKGITSYLPTIISTDEDTTTRTLRDIEKLHNDPKSTVVGAHLEGPFLNPSSKGVHRVNVPKTTTDYLPSYVSHPSVKLITLAPELPGALDLISSLAKKGVIVSIGHSSATPSQATKATLRGASMVTHLFNGMPPFHHRDPGLIGWALTNPKIDVGIIADGIHTHPTTLNMIHTLAGDRVILVSDASVGALAPTGTYRQAGVTLQRHNDGRVTDTNNNLAGSGITLADAVKIYANSTNASPTQVIRAATYKPAEKIGLPCGVEPGNTANLVIWDKYLNVSNVIFRGKIV